MLAKQTMWRSDEDGHVYLQQNICEEKYTGLIDVKLRGFFSFPIYQHVRLT